MALVEDKPKSTVTDPAQDAKTAHRRPRVVVIGAGFGGLSCVKDLGDAPVDVTLVDKRNYHLFQPLLYQVATAALSPADIAAPIRGIVGRQKNTTVLLARVTGIDVIHRRVIAEDRQIPYDILVVATGARHSYFGRDDWEPFAPGIKKIEDATNIRRRILHAFERAESEPDPVERQKLLTFVVIGGGPTGVELAGAIAELGKRSLSKDFRHIDPRDTRVVLIEAGQRVLATYPEKLSAIAKKSLEKLGVEVRLGAPVTKIDNDGVEVAGQAIAARTVLWGAGVAASPAAKWLGADKDRAGRVKVGEQLTLPGHEEIFVIGDTALATDKKGKPLPGTAPVAKQQGSYVARVIAARATGKVDPAPFHYRHPGSLATIGRRAAIADFGWFRMSGYFAWILWGIVHVLFLVGFRNRVAVLLDWFWSYVTFQPGARLITGPLDDEASPNVTY